MTRKNIKHVQRRLSRAEKRSLARLLKLMLKAQDKPASTDPEVQAMIAFFEREKISA